MVGELDFGPPCRCEQPKYMGVHNYEELRREVEKFRADPYGYEYPWAGQPVPRDASLKSQLQIATRRYGLTFMLPIIVGLGQEIPED